MVGGLLVALAAVGTFVAASGRDSGPRGRYVVALQRIAPGRPLRPGDVGVQPVDLPSAMGPQAFGDPATVLGAVPLGPIEPGELIQRGLLVPHDGAASRPEMSFAVDPDRAVGGSLRAGERVDLLVTYGSGASSSTERVVTGADLREVTAGAGDGLGAVHRQTLTVALGGSEVVLAAANAVRAGEVTVVRSTGTAPSGDPTRYAPAARRTGPES